MSSFVAVLPQPPSQSHSVHGHKIVLYSLSSIVVRTILKREYKNKEFNEQDYCCFIEALCKYYEQHHLSSCMSISQDSFRPQDQSIEVYCKCKNIQYIDNDFCNLNFNQSVCIAPSYAADIMEYSHDRHFVYFVIILVLVNSILYYSCLQMLV